METEMLLVPGGLSLIIVVLFFYSVSLRSKNREYEKRLLPIVSIENEVAKAAAEKDGLEKSIDDLRAEYKKKKALFDDLVQHAAIYDESIDLAELGFYKPHYDYDTPEKYKDEIDRVREKQKDMVRNKSAIYCTTEWTVSGSKRKGRTMTDRGIRLAARAFNNECDAAISNTRWNNAERIEQRIIKAFDAINKLNQSSAIFISQEYLDLKLQEFRLAYEYQEKKRKQKEEQSELRRRMREEAKLAQEVEAALKDEERYQGLVDKAKKEAEKATGDKLAKLEEKLAKLTADLAVAHEKSERAQSMAQKTKAGHVYVISNIGSFGRDVYKIGMTRRLDPVDRIKELGDASVPFPFDTHALIYSENAPSLESMLHEMLGERKINLANSRKEFFKVSLDEIIRLVESESYDAEFYKIPEAREYHESESILAQLLHKKTESDERNKFPDEI